MRSMFAFVLLLGSACATAVTTAARSVTPARVTAPAVTISATSEAIVVNTNIERRAAGLTEFRRVTSLMQAAQVHAEQMATSQRMSHDLPGSKYPAPVDRINAVGYEWSTYGENVAEGYPDASGVVTGWMKSTGHRANILSNRFTEMGAGVATGANGRRYFVQVFGSPR